MNTQQGRGCANPQAHSLLHWYHLLVEYSSDVMVRIAVDGAIEWTSPAVTALLGFEPHDLVGVRPVDLAHPDDVPVAREAQGDLAKGRSAEIRLRMRTRDGGYVWVGARATPFLVDGVVSGGVAMWRDIPQEQTAREALAQQERVFRFMIDQAADMVVHTTDGMVTWVSAGIERCTGWSRDELVGHRSVAKVHPDDRSALGEVRRSRTPELPAKARIRFLCRDGGTKWLEVVSTPFLNSDGTGSAVSVMRDISDRVAAEQERDRVYERLDATLDSLLEPHGHLSPVVDDTGMVVDLEITSVNSAARSYLRQSAPTLVGSRVSRWFPRQLQEGLLEVVRELLATGTPFSVDDVRAWNDLLGEHRIYDIRLILVEGMVSMTFRDVTERHLRFDAEARVQAAQALSNERARVARDLHDGAIQKVFATSMRLAALAAQVDEPLRRSVEELIDLQDIVIRDLRTTVYQLGTTGRRAAAPLHAVHDTVAEVARALGFSPEVFVDDRLVGFDDVTLGHLLLVLREALSNVARHAHAHHAEVSLVAIGSDVTLSVWDDGVGLPVEVVHGEGLRNMERRAALLGGCCRISSEPGQGTELLWRVPVRAG